MSSQTFSTFSEVGMIDARSQNGTITLPLTTDIPYRILTLKDIYGAASVSSITLTTQGADVFEDGATTRILNGSFETTTLYAGQAGFWYIIGGSRLATAAIGTLSTGIISNPLRLGTLSTQTVIQFPGLSSNYTGTVITGQRTGVGTQELLLYQTSSISDQIRLQTTGNIVFEAGAAARSWPSTSALATPTLYIQGSSSNIGVGTASPATTLDVVGTGRFQTVSTLALSISTINGQTTSQLAAIPIQSTVIGLGTVGYVSSLTNVPVVSTLSLNISTINGQTTSQLAAIPIQSTVAGLGTTGYVSSLTNVALVSTHSLNAGSVYASNVVVKNSGSLTSNQYGPGIDTISIQSQNAGFSGGTASLYFGSSESTYPLARIGALDQGIFHATSALVFQTATPNNASLLTANTFSYTGSNQTFTVPVGVTSITVYAWGAGGGGKVNTGGAGAMVQGVLTVTPGETLTIVVGGGGSGATTTVISAYGGGGAAGVGDGGQAGGGGGRTAIQRGGTAATNDIVVAGGGGGGTFFASNKGGSATFSGTANNGTSSSGTYQGYGGSQTAGGAGGAVGYGTGTPGSRGQGGSVTDYNTASSSDGGGGGGGYYGGGGGGTGPSDAGGGGGGSSFTGNLSLIPGQSVFGFNSTDGSSAPNTSSPYYSAGVAVGTASAGGNGLLVVTYNSPFRLTETMRINSNAYIGIGTANPQALLHVSGMTYSIETSTQALTISTINGQTTSQLAAIPIQSTVIGLGSARYVSSLINVPLVSTQAINVSSVNGIIPGAAFNGSTMALSTSAIRTSSLTASQITASNLVLNGTETINFNGGVGAAGYGEGIDTLSLKSPLTAYNGGIASLFFGNGTTAYPLARIAAIDSATEAPGASALVFQTATEAINASLTGINIFTATGADQSYTVPTGVTSINISMWSAGGGGSGSTGGAGVYVKGVMAVTPGQTLKVVVGGAGRYNSLVRTYGGGGAGGANVAASGGGRSALQIQVVTVVTGASSSGTAFTYTTSTAHNLAAGYGVAISGLVTPAYNINGLITGVTSNTFTIANTATPATITSQSGSIFLEILDAGGGGGAYNGGGGAAGNGGLTNGQAASTNNNNNSGGGSQTAGGQAGTTGGQGAGVVGSMFAGGNGGTGGNGGGGGGGGWFGGGGGNGVGSGGGGSSYISYPAFTLSDSGFTSNFSRSAPGTTDTYYQSGVAVGGAGGNDGGPGLIVIVASPTYAMGEAMRISRFGFVGVGMSNPSTMLDVAGTGRFQTLSTLSLNISTINGQTTSQLAAIPIQSTVVGLGTTGYVSAPQLAATSNYFRNLLFLNVSSAISTAALYTSNTSNYFNNLLTFNISSAVSSATLFTSNTSNFILSTNQSSISTAYITANQGYISSLVVDSLAIGSNLGYINMGDLITTSLSTLQINSGSLTTPEIIVSSINGQQPLTIQNLTSTVAGTNSNISSMIDPAELTSTVTGLGTANFISSVGLTTILASTVTGVNTTIVAMIDPVELASSITGLGSAGFISSIGLDTRFASTAQGLGLIGYISSAQLQSTVRAITGSTLSLSAGSIFASSISTSQFWAQNVNAQAVSTNALVFGSGTGTLLMPDIAPNTIYTSTMTASNVQIGWTSNQSPLQFYGYGTYSNSVIVEQSTGTTTQELFVFRGSNSADRIRFQTTGYMAIETGVSSRLYTAALSNATPAVMIDINSNVGIKLAAPAFPLDVGGTIRAPTLSSLTLQTSTIEGAIFTRDLYANARTFLQGEVSTPFLLGNYNTLSFRTAGIQRATFTQAGNLGIGLTNPQFPVDIAGITRVSTIYNSTSISYNFISAPLLIASTVNTENVQTNTVSTNQINASLIYGRWNDAQYYVLQSL